MVLQRKQEHLGHNMETVKETREGLSLGSVCLDCKVHFKNEGRLQQVCLASFCIVFLLTADA